MVYLGFILSNYSKKSGGSELDNKTFVLGNLNGDKESLMSFSGMLNDTPKAPIHRNSIRIERKPTIPRRNLSSIIVTNNKIRRRNQDDIIMDTGSKVLSFSGNELMIVNYYSEFTGNLRPDIEILNKVQEKNNKCSKQIKEIENKILLIAKKQQECIEEGKTSYTINKILDYPNDQPAFE